MSDKTPRDEFDDMELEFPGADRPDLTEEEREFTFDEDYLKDTAPPPAADDREAKLDALESLFRSEQKKERRGARDASDKTAPAADAGGRSEDGDAPPDGAADAGGAEKEDALFAAFTRLVKKEKTEEVWREPDAGGGESGADLVPESEGAGLNPWQRRQMNRRRKADPVTVGQVLRPDQMLVYDSELDDIDYTDDEDLPELRDYMPIRFRRYGRVGIGGGILYALFVISVSIVLACAAWMLAADVLALNKEPLNAIVTIEEYEPAGDDPATVLIDDEEVEIKVDIDQVADELKSAGLIEYKWLFKLYSRFSHANTKIDPGTFDVSTELDYRALVTALQFGSGNQEITRITFPEGYSIEQIFTLLEENHIRHKDELYEAAANYDFDYDFLEDLPKGDPNRLEGYLFPDTYDFYEGEDASVAINRFLRNLDNKLTDEIREAAAARDLSIHELLTMASLIEKEAGSNEERPIMASVIYNRLNAGMLLQLDSTINYIQGTSTFDISIEDTEIDDPYNTYMYEGLPPGPICNPGMESIQAAVNPEETDYWYWYSVDGVSTFFTNYDDFKAFQDEHPVE